MRDVLSQRWVRTEETYERENPKRVYYLSMEFLLGRSLANNVKNLMLDPSRQQLIKEKNLDWLGLLEQEPDAGLGNGGLGRLAACFLDSMATMQLPAMGYGLRYEYGMFRQTIQNGWQQEQPDNWLRRPDPWEVARPQKGRSAAELLVRGARRERYTPSRRSAVHSDRHSRLIARSSAMAARPSTRFGCGPPPRQTTSISGVQPRRFRRRLAEKLAAESLTRVLYPDDSTSLGQGLRFVQEYFLVACSLADIVRRFRRNNADWSALPEKVAIQLNDTHPAMAVPELMRILLDEAQLGWDEAWDLTRRTLAYTNHTLLARSPREMAGGVVRDAVAAPPGDHL